MPLSIQAALARRLALLAGVAVGCASANAQSYLTYVDSNSDMVHLADPTTGVLDTFGWIVDDVSSTNYNFQTPIEAIQVGNEIWVTDQLSDAIYRFTANYAAPTFISGITTQLDNVRGLALVGNRVYVSNSGTANGAPGRSIVVYETDGTLVGSLSIINPLTNLAVDPFDVSDFNGQLLISDIEGEDLVVCNTDGTNVSVLFDGNANLAEFPQQTHITNSGPSGSQEVWVDCFSSPAGVYRLTAQGVQVAYYPVTTGGRGMWVLPRLDTGEERFLYSDGVVPNGGILRRQIGLPTSDLIVQGSGRFIGSVTFTSQPVCDSIDFNNDTSLFDPQDIDAFLSVYSEGPCIPDTATCSDIDFNNDSSVFDPCDIDSFLLVFSEGPCTLCGI
ncbi:MAG: hypothetical protein U0640_06270 [Phycisphaerales bacterium]